MKVLTTAITIAVASFVLDRMYNRDSTVNSDGQNDYHYVVCPPEVLSKIYRIQIGFGLFMFAFFYYFYVTGNPTAQMGHLIMSLVVAGLGLIVIVFAKGWNLIVDGEDIVLKRLLRATVRMKISDIERYELGKKGEIKLYHEGRKFTTVDPLCDNYDRFLNALQNAGVRG